MMAEEITQENERQAKSNFCTKDLQEWDVIRVWIKRLLKKKHKDYKIVCVDKSVEV